MSTVKCFQSSLVLTNTDEIVMPTGSRLPASNVEVSAGYRNPIEFFFKVSTTTTYYKITYTGKKET